MNGFRRTLIAVLGAIACLLGLAAQTASASGLADTSTGPEGTTVTRAQIIERLNPSERAKFMALSEAEQRRSVEVVSDPDFAVPGREAAVAKKYPGAATRVATSESANPTDVQQASAMAGTRNSWYKQWWTFLGVTYASVQTTAQYQTSGARAYGIEYCQGSYTNLVPGRQISYWPSYTNNSDGTITCRTNWTVIKAGIQEVNGVQGFRVNGYGTFIRKWSID
ncbi:hypothetical protein BCF74_11386 [Knoellia remsis]|uniref:Uncharacterized protein n=2 Tax=Knoellia remsis TaxID=407159 RepID=A0A2T0UJR5_9MICO|nr:hypothetical protein BCF74_11386 [Knoellia remsis]